MSIRSLNIKPLFFSLLSLLAIFIYSDIVLSAENNSGRLIDVKGEVLVMPNGGSWQRAASGKMLFEGDTLKTGASGWAAILMSDETLVQISRNSMFAVKNVSEKAGWFGSTKKESGNSEYRLDSGKAWMRNKNKNVPIDIETPSVTAAIRGTELNIQVAENKSTLITVLSGRVGCRNEIGTVVAEKNQQISASQGSHPAVNTILSPEDSVQWTVTIPIITGPADMPIAGKKQTELVEYEQTLESLSSASYQRRDTRISLGEVKRDLGKKDEAEKILKESISSGFDRPDSPDEKRAFRALGWVYLDMKRPNDAESAFKRSVSGDKMTLIGLAESYFRQGKYEMAFETNSMGTVLFTNDPEFLIQKAFFEIRSHENLIAEQTLENLVKNFPDYPLGWSALSLLNLYKGDKDSAITFSGKAISMNPDSPTPYIVKSYVMQAAFDLDSATKSIETALMKAPKNTTALVNLAKLQFGGDHTEKAMETIKKAEEISPENGEVHSTMGFILLALRKTDDATESFKKAILADRSLGEAYLGYALSVMRNGETDEALQYISAAITLEPRRSLFVSYWGKILYEIRRFDRSLEVLELASNLDPMDPTPHLYTAVILNELNRPSEAIEALNKSIALNDNKAVYNSRFILDRDLAVKSVGLAYLYNRLGLSDWGTNKALASLKQDYTNFAAHMFYGGGYYLDGDKSRLYASETLIGKILQPATPNTYNSFNNYTSFFEQPTINTAISGELSSHDTYAGSTLVSGSLPEINSAFSIFAQKKNSDGWKDTGNKTEIDGLTAEIKADPSLSDNISIINSIYDTKTQYDERAYDYSYVPDPEEKLKSTNFRTEAGYHRHIGPGKDLLLYFKRIDIDNTLKTHDFYGPIEFTNNYPPPEVLHANVDYYQSDHIKQPLYQLQGQYLFPSGNHQITAGSLRYWDDIQNGSTNKESIHFIEYDETYTDETTISRKADNSFTSLYLKDIWEVTSNVIIDSAIYYDVMDYESYYGDLSADQNELNPRLGLIWRPQINHTIRASIFRYLLPFYSSRIDSTEVAGFPIFRNSSAGDVTIESGFAYEYSWDTGILGSNLFYLDKENKYKQNDENNRRTSVKQSGYSKGLDLFYNQLFFAGLGLKTKYSYKEISNDIKQEANMRDHKMSASITGVSRDGLYATLSQTFRYMDRTSYGLTDEDAWLTDVILGADFKDKKGNISLMVLNIFDNHFDWTQEAYLTEGGRVPTTEYRFITSLYF